MTDFDVLFVSVFVALYFWGTIYGKWKLFNRLGYNKFSALVPIWNYYTITKITRNSRWYVIGFYIPYVNIMVRYIVFRRLAKSMNFGRGFTLLLVFIPPIGWPIIAERTHRFDDAVFSFPKTESTSE